MQHTILHFGEPILEQREIIIQLTNQGTLVDLDQSTSTNGNIESCDGYPPFSSTNYPKYAFFTFNA
jgi:hypothetical protein